MPRKKIYDKSYERALTFAKNKDDYMPNMYRGSFMPAMNKYQAMDKYGADYQLYNYYSSDDDDDYQGQKVSNPGYNTAELFDLEGGRRFKHALLGNITQSGNMNDYNFGAVVGNKIVIFGTNTVEIVGEPEKILKLENFSGGSGVVVNETTIWLVETGRSKASSFISLNENGDLSLESGPESPFSVWGPMIQFDESTIYVLGAEGEPKESGEPTTSKPKRKKKANGWSTAGKAKKAGPIQVKDPRKTFIVDPTNNYSWKEGPPMIETKKEANLVCAKMIMDGRVVIVAVAKHAHKGLHKPKMSIEILDPKASNVWQLGNFLS